MKARLLNQALVNNGGMLMRVELLLERIARNRKVKSWFEQMENLPEDALIEALMNDFEQVIERYRDLSFYAGEASRAAAHTNSSSHSFPIAKSSEAKNESAPPLLIDPISIELPPINLLQTADSSVRAPQPNEARVRHELESIEQLISGEIQRAWENRPRENHDRVLSSMPVTRFAASKAIHALDRPPLKTESAPEPLSTGDEICEDDILYVYGVEIREASEETQSWRTMPAIKGIDARHPIIEYRWKGNTFFISKTSTDFLNFTSLGVMLLSKQESLILLAKHEEILNTLRVNKRILSFAFGSVVRGKEELMKKLSEMETRLQSEIERERQLNSWTVKLLVLDTQVAKLCGVHQSGMENREQQRGEMANRVDIRLLEKILHYERKIAEGVHNVLSLCSLSSTIVSMISLGQGTSPDWKLIFHASYVTDRESRKNFFAAVQGLQEEYKMVGLMLSVSGFAGRLEFSPTTPALQATST